MLSNILILLFSLNIIQIQAHKYLVKFDEDILKKLQVSSSLNSYDEFELLNNYQCAIECIKDKNSCTGYSFNETTNICSLFEDSTKTIDNNLVELVI